MNELFAVLSTLLTLGIIAAGVVYISHSRPRSVIREYRRDLEQRQRASWYRIVGGGGQR